MNELMRKFFQWAIPGKGKPSAVKRMYLLGSVHFYGSACFFVFGLLYWFFVHSAYMLTSNFFFGVISAANWFVYKKNRKDCLMSTTFLIIVYVGLMNVVIHLGVRNSPLSYWGMSVAVAAAFIYSIPGILAWLAACLAFFPLTLYIKRTWLAHRAIPLDMFQTELLNEASYYGILLFLGYTVYLFQRKLLRTLRELEDSEEKYHSLFKAEADAIMVFDEQTLEIRDVNPSFCKLYGYSYDEAVKKTAIDISAEPEKTVKAIQSRQTFIPSRIHKKKDGTIFSVDISTTFFNQKGRQLGVGTIRDITGRKQIEEERERLFIAEREARNDAHHANAAKDVFLAMLSHELRTPLTTIRSWSQILRMPKITPEKARHGLDMIEKSVRDQTRIIEDILDISRIVTGKFQLKPDSVRVSPILSETLDAIKIAAQEKTLTIRTEIDPTLDAMIADPVRLKQIFLNLISNAIKFSFPGGVINVLLERGRSEQLKFSVQDHGKGIPPQFLSQIFEPFTQADSSRIRSHGGLGLGLTIARSLVELHGGTITAESPGEGQGSTFTVLLPLQGKSVSLPKASDAVSQEWDNIDLTTLKILVVDDEASSREAMATLLESFGAEVVTAANAAEAFTRVRELTPHLLLSDLAMPGEDGYSLIQKIRTLLPSPLKDIPAIAVTAFAGEEERKRALSSGFQMFVEKPFEASVLLRNIETLWHK